MSDTLTVRNLVFRLASQGDMEELYSLIFNAKDETRFEISQILPLLTQNQLAELESMVRDRLWRDKETERFLTTLF